MPGQKNTKAAATKTTAKAKSSKAKADTVIGFVDAGKTYTINGICKALGVEERTVREARMNGLVTRLIGGRRLIISGSEFNEWVKVNAPIAPVPRGKGADDESEDDE